MSNANNCPICFEELVDNNTASLDVCEHIFCQPCLEKWSKHGTYCPIDRKRFKKIISLNSENVIQVKPCKPKHSRVLYDVTVYCEVCKKHNNAGSLLLCDCCDLGYHCKCLSPPLKEVPAGQWYCPVCSAVESRMKTSKAPTKEMKYKLEEQMASKHLLKNTKDQTVHVIQRETTVNLKKDAHFSSLNLLEIENISLLSEDIANCHKYSYKQSGNEEIRQNILSEKIKKTSSTKERKNVDCEETTNECESIENKTIQVPCQNFDNNSTQINLKETENMFPVSLSIFSKSQRGRNVNQDATNCVVLNREKRINCNKRNSRKAKDIENNCSESKFIFIKDTEIHNNYDSIGSVGVDDYNSAESQSNNLGRENNKKKFVVNKISKTCLDNRTIKNYVSASQTNFEKGSQSKLRQQYDNNGMVVECLYKKDKKKLINFHNEEIYDKSELDFQSSNNAGSMLSSINRETVLKASRNSRDLYGERLDSGDCSFIFQSGFVKNVEGIENVEKPCIKNGIVSTSLKRIPVIMCDQEETIDIGAYSLATQSDTGRKAETNQNILGQSAENVIVLPKKRHNKKFTFEKTDIGYYNPATSTNFVKSLENIQNIKEPCTKHNNAKISQVKNYNKKCVQGNTKDITEKSVQQIGTPTCDKSITSEHTKMGITFTDLHKNDNENQTIIPKQPSELRNNYPMKQSRIIKSVYNYHTGKEAAGWSLGSKDISKTNRKEETLFENDFSAKIPRKEVSVCTSQSMQKEKRKVSSNCKYLLGDTEDNASKVFKIQPKNIVKKKNPSYHEQLHKKDTASSSLIKLKESLIENIQNSRATRDSCVSSPIHNILHKTSSTIVQSSFTKNKNIPNSLATNSNFPSPEKADSQINFIDGNNLHRKIKQGISSKNLQFEDIPISNSVFSLGDKKICESVQSTKSCDINSSTKASKNKGLASSHFSVFVPLKDTVESSQKYLNINLAVSKKCRNTTSSLFSDQFVTPQKSFSMTSENNTFSKSLRSCHNLGKSRKGTHQDSVHDPSQNPNIRELDYAIQAKMNLAEKLKKIEREKWASSLKKKKHLHLDHTDNFKNS